MGWPAGLGLALALTHPPSPCAPCCSPLGYYTIWQTAYSTAPTYKVWASQSQAAYIYAAAKLSGLPASGSNMW